MTRSDKAHSAGGSAITSDDRIDVDYCRISYDKSNAGEGVGTQHGKNAEFASANGRDITETYIDNDVSAYDKEVTRPDYLRLCRNIAADLVRSVTIRHADRLHRDIEQASQFMRLAIDHGVRLFSVSRGGEYNLTTSQGRHDFLSDTLRGQGESDHRSERVNDARERQALNGRWGGGNRPYGWGVDTGRVRHVCVNPKDPPIERRYEDRPVLDMSRHNVDEIKEIRKWKNDLLAGVKMSHILQDLTARKVLTQGQKDNRALKRNGKPIRCKGWDSATIRQILLNPRTVGHSVHRGKIVKRNAYLPIITEAEQEALRAHFKDPRRKTSPGNTPKWLGSLIYLCGICDDGTTMTVKYNSKIPGYRCRKHGHCRRPAKLVDEYVEEVMIERLSADDIIDLLPERTTVDVAALQDELLQLDKREIEAGIQGARGEITEVMMKVHSAEITKRRGDIFDLLRNTAGESPLAEFVGNPNPAATWYALSLGRKREILRLLARVTVKPGFIGRYQPRFNPRTALDVADPSAGSTRAA